MSGDRAEVLAAALAAAPHPAKLISDDADTRSLGIIAYMDWWYKVRLAALQPDVAEQSEESR